MKKIMKQAQACGSRAKPYAFGFWAIQAQESQYIYNWIILNKLLVVVM